MKVAAALILVCATPVSAQTTWHVDLNGTPPGSGTLADPYTSIQHAIDRASTLNGDTLVVRPGTYFESVEVTKGVTLRSSAGADSTTIRPSASGPVVALNALQTVRLEGFTVTGGFNPSGDGVCVVPGTTGHVTRSILRDNERHGLFCDYDGFVDRCTIVRNGASSLTVTMFPNGLSATHCIMVDNELPPHFGSFLGSISWNIIDLGPQGDVVGDPRFWNDAANDFHLRSGSAAIDSGSNMVSERDPDGSPADLGALVFDPSHPATPVGYCTARTNSQGCVPAIGTLGTPSASGSAFEITCDNVLNGKSGLLFYGYEGKATTYQGGWLCARAPVRRTPIQDSGGNPPPDDCSGQYSFDFDARIQSGTDPALLAGESIYVQYWYRDSAQSGPFTTARSDAVYFLIAP